MGGFLSGLGRLDGLGLILSPLIASHMNSYIRSFPFLQYVEGNFLVCTLSCTFLVLLMKSITFFIKTVSS
uniref:Putative ovule protein n=1 Tax=Solanum chacoense TaxID=4108 RepID=A0A0V0HP24_SOLCH